MTTREFLDAYNRITSSGWLSMEEALLLVSYAELVHGPIVEIGSYMGRSAMLLAQLPGERTELDDTGGVISYGLVKRTVYCIDPWADGFHDTLTGDRIFEVFLENAKQFPNVTPCRSRVETMAPIASCFVYCDGDHTYTGTLAQLCYAKACIMKAGGHGYILVHDVNDTGDGKEIARACLEMLGPWKERLHRLAAWEIRCN